MIFTYCLLLFAPPKKIQTNWDDFICRVKLYNSQPAMFASYHWKSFHRLKMSIKSQLAFIRGCLLLYLLSFTILHYCFFFLFMCIKFSFLLSMTCRSFSWVMVRSNFITFSQINFFSLKYLKIILQFKKKFFCLSSSHCYSVIACICIMPFSPVENVLDFSKIFIIFFLILSLELYFIFFFFSNFNPKFYF